MALYGVRCHRSKNSVFGEALSWLKENNTVKLFEDEAMAEQVAKHHNENGSPNLRYWAEEYHS